MNAPAVFDVLSCPPEFPDMEPHFAAFASYARGFYTGDSEHDFHLDLKVEHSCKVFGHARALAEAERDFAADAVMRRALLLAALYHDLGRFRQYHEYGTFSDPHSVNHAQLGMREVNRLGLLNREDARVRRLTLTAVLLHNRFAVPPRLAGDAAAVSRALRDADKLDIMRIMAGHLTVDGPVDPVIALNAENSPRATPVVLDAALARRPGLYADLATITDFKLLVCGWLYDLNYPSAKALAAGGGWLAALLASLPRTEELAAFIVQYGRDLAAYAPA